MHLTNSSLSKPFDSWQEKTEPGNHCGGFVAAGFTVKLWEGRMEGKEFAGSPAAQALPGPGGFPQLAEPPLTALSSQGAPLFV